MTHTFWLQSPESGKTHLSLDLHRRRLQTQHNWVCSATSPNENQNARCQRECWTKQWSESQQCLSELVCSRLSLLLCWIAALISIFSMKAIFSPLYNTFSVLLCQLEKGLVWDKPPTFAKTTDPTPAESMIKIHRLCRRWISGFCKGWWLVPHTAALWSRRRRCSLYWRALCSCRGCCGWRWRWWCVTAGSRWLWAVRPLPRRRDWNHSDVILKQFWNIAFEMIHVCNCRCSQPNLGLHKLGHPLNIPNWLLPL